MANMFPSRCAVVLLCSVVAEATMGTLCIDSASHLPDMDGFGHDTRPDTYAVIHSKNGNGAADIMCQTMPFSDAVIGSGSEIDVGLSSLVNNNNNPVYNVCCDWKWMESAHGVTIWDMDILPPGDYIGWASLEDLHPGTQTLSLGDTGASVTITFTVKSPAPPPAPHPPGFSRVCKNTCRHSGQDHWSEGSDGKCKDGGPGSMFVWPNPCELGTDCADCGVRFVQSSLTSEPLAEPTAAPARGFVVLASASVGLAAVAVVLIALARRGTFAKATTAPVLV